MTHAGAVQVPTCSGAFKAHMVELLDAVRDGRQAEWQAAALAAAARDAPGAGPAGAGNSIEVA
jgi:hypothetical protein